MGGYTEIYVSAALSLGPQAERDTTFPHPFLKELKNDHTLHHARGSHGKRQPAAVERGA